MVSTAEPLPAVTDPITVTVPGLGLALSTQPSDEVVVGETLDLDVSVQNTGLADSMREPPAPPSFLIPLSPMTAEPTIAQEFLAIVEDIDRRLSLPKVKRVWLPNLSDTPRKSGEFGAVILSDDSVGLLFVLLGDTLRSIGDSCPPEAWVGMDPVELARGFADSDPATRALGLGAINAIGQHVIRASGFTLDTETNSLGSFDPQPDDRFGMVGFFPPLVRRLREQSIDLTVIELKKDLVQRSPGFRVSLDPADLGRCNKILGTSTMLLNDSIDPMLAHCGQAQEVAIIGPSAGFLPDPLFARGVETVGGHQVVDVEGFIARCVSEEKWGSTSRKYCFHRSTYPGYRTLLDSVVSPGPPGSRSHGRS